MSKWRNIDWERAFCKKLSIYKRPGETVSGEQIESFKRFYSDSLGLERPVVNVNSHNRQSKGRILSSIIIPVFVLSPARHSFSGGGCFRDSCLILFFGF